MFGMHHRTFVEQITRVLKAIDSELAISFPFRDMDKLQAIEAGFRVTSLGRVKGCVGAGKT